ncbi:hypothetical protein DNK08_07225 [Stutzerimonas kirkiae]|nr:hypothetical protein DNK08_07225 [Stutzerimonas kirkiae]
MFEKVASRTAKTLYALAMGLGVIALAWLCLAKLPLVGAIFAFCVGLPLLALVAGPIAAVASGLAGVAVGLLATAGATARRARSGG